MAEIIGFEDNSPVINSPYEEPKMHLDLDKKGMPTGKIVSGRRTSAYFSPVPPTKKGQSEVLEHLSLPNEDINSIRKEVKEWRERDYLGSTNISRKLLDWWSKNRPETPKLFFCQIEAIETAIWLAEIAMFSRREPGRLYNKLRKESAEWNDGSKLQRTAFKVATGGGKTAVMAMLIAWQTLNSIRGKSQRYKYCSNFLVVAPGITVRERLRVLVPSDSQSLYKNMSLLPPEYRKVILRAKVEVINYHSFLPRDKDELKTTVVKDFSGIGETGANKETPGEIANRVCRSFGRNETVIAINDEGHHCYFRGGACNSDETQTEKKDNYEGVWFEGLRALASRNKLNEIYDLSATPFFINDDSSKNRKLKPNTLFPWTASDFSLIDAIEAGIVKVPTAPVDDSATNIQKVVSRHVWPDVRNEFKDLKRTRKDPNAKPRLPSAVEHALLGLYDRYKKTHEMWEKTAEDGGPQAEPVPPPVMIVVCQDTNVSNIIYRRIVGLDGFKGGEPDRRGPLLPIFSNFDGENKPLARPPTILIDSESLDSGTAYSKEFEKAMAYEIAIYKSELAKREGVEEKDLLLEDRDILREVVNTVGKPGKLGGMIKCVVSVAMLSEGWDASNVTHILGVRAFGSQLLCEQVIGRGLRRQNYDKEALITRKVECDGEIKLVDIYNQESVDVWGIPFSFLTHTAKSSIILPTKKTLVKALDEREEKCEISGIPLVSGYCHYLPPPSISHKFDERTRLKIDGDDAPTIDTAAILGLEDRVTQVTLRDTRPEKIAYAFAARVLAKLSGSEKEFSSPDPRIFPEVLNVVRAWLHNKKQLILKNDAFLQMVSMDKYSDIAVEKIALSISLANPGEPIILPLISTELSTHGLEFWSSKKEPDPLWPTPDDGKCHISHIAADSGWEIKVADRFESMGSVNRYTKNEIELGFYIPYRDEADNLHKYFPDFILCATQKNKNEEESEFRLIVEVSGYPSKKKLFKAAEAEKWCNTLNTLPGIKERWGFVEITNPDDTEKMIEAKLENMRKEVSTSAEKLQ